MNTFMASWCGFVISKVGTSLDLLYRNGRWVECQMLISTSLNPNGRTETKTLPAIGEQDALIHFILNSSSIAHFFHTHITLTLQL